jgi:hypothetical protein
MPLVVAEPDAWLLPPPNRDRGVLPLVHGAADVTRDPIAALRGTAELAGSFGNLARDLRALREEAGAALEQRAARARPRAKRRG